MDDIAPTFPTEEYIAGRQRGRTAGLKRKLKARFIKIATVVFLGGSFCALTFSSTAVTGYSHGSPRIFVSILGVFVLLGGIFCFGVWRSYEESMKNLREDIVRSVMTPDDAMAQAGRIRKWWIKGAVERHRLGSNIDSTPLNQRPSDTEPY